MMQHALADELTSRVHSTDELDKAKNASQMLFGKATSESLKALDEATILDVFEGVPQATVSKSELENGTNIIDLLAAKSGFLASNGEARRALKENSISVNKEKVKDDFSTSPTDLIDGKYLLLQRGKKNYFLVIAD